jgi:phosphoglycolate phosphatase-like HAD superfamily hydrolase
MMPVTVWQIVFDFDGPIFDGRAAADQSLQQTIDHFAVQFGKPRLSFECLPLLGTTSLISLLYKSLEVRDRHAIRSYYRSSLQQAERRLGVANDVHEVLTALRKLGFSMGLFSGRRSDDLTCLLSDLGLLATFI